MGDYRRALDVLRSIDIPQDAIELSALRESELAPLLADLPTLDLSRWSCLSIHGPGRFTDSAAEQWAASALEATTAGNDMLLVMHPDGLLDESAWRRLGDRLCIENMDLRKPIGQTVEDLERIFRRFPEASFCFDVGHAFQVDPSGTEARLMLRRFRDRLREVHLSHVNSASGHESLHNAAMASFLELLPMIPEGAAIILESPCAADDMPAAARDELAYTHWILDAA